jgi:hypothetical protein
LAANGRLPRGVFLRTVRPALSMIAAPFSGVASATDWT